MKVSIRYVLFLILALSIFVLSACGGADTTSSPQATPSTSTTNPVATNNPTQVSSSDIPDTQTFIVYSSSTDRYRLEVPEGWARTVQASNVSFVFNLDGIQVSTTKATTAPTANTVRADQAATLQQTGQSVQDMTVQDVHLTNGPAVLMTYTSNSDPDPVTGKQVRLENNRYLFYNNGKLATLTLWAPVGADNRDQWTRIANSFKWV